MCALRLIQHFGESEETKVSLGMSHFSASIWELLSDKAGTRRDLWPQDSAAHKVEGSSKTQP